MKKILNLDFFDLNVYLEAISGITDDYDRYYENKSELSCSYYEEEHFNNAEKKLRDFINELHKDIKIETEASKDSKIKDLEQEVKSLEEIIEKLEE